MAKRKTKRVLRLDTGQEFEIVSERGRYYVCKGTQFRKSNPAIQKIYEVKGGEDHADG